MSKEKPVVLIADDEADIRELVSFRLEQSGYEVVVAEDGRQALDLLREVKPDLAVLDVMMPHLDGYEVTAEIRRDEDLKGTPVILLTARAQEQDVQRGFDAGADDYIRKPFSPQELRSRVESALSRG